MCDVPNDEEAIQDRIEGSREGIMPRDLGGTRWGVEEVKEVEGGSDNDDQGVTAAVASGGNGGRAGGW